MRTFVKTALTTTLLAGMLFAGAAVGSAQVSIAVQIGPPPPARVVRVPPRPAAEFVWIEGYWYPVRGRYIWHEGYWTRPPYAGARWVAPRYNGRAYMAGYWGGARGRYEHDHRWDKERERDFHDRGDDRGHDNDRRDDHGRH